MQGIVYPDMIFLIQFFMNLLLLLAEQSFLKQERILNCTAAAFTGALLATTVICVCGVHNRAGMVISVILLPFIMIWISFGIGKLLFHTLLFFTEAVFMGGMLTALMNVLQPVLQTSFFLQSGLLFIPICTAAFLFAVHALWKEGKTTWNEYRLYAKVHIHSNHTRVKATALMDTGNRLLDPYQKKPVVLVDAGLFYKLVHKQSQKGERKCIFIPYQSIGCDEGIMEGTYADCLRLFWKGKEFEWKKVLLAKSPGSVLSKNAFQIIFNMKLLEEKNC